MFCSELGSTNDGVSIYTSGVTICEDQTSSMQINTDAVYKLNVGGSDAVTREEGYLPLCPSKNTLLSIGWMAAGSFGFESSAKATAISKLSAKSSAFPAMLLERCFF